MKYVGCAMVLFGVCGGAWSAFASAEEPGRVAYGNIPFLVVE